MSTARVLFDDEAFIRHRRSGITRYFAELIGQFRGDPALAVEPITPYRWVANAHLTHGGLGGRYTALPIPASRRVQALQRLNRRRVSRPTGADLVHHSLYEPDALQRWTAPQRVVTIYDFTFERLPEIFPNSGPAIADKQRFIQECDALLCISETTRADLEQFHPDLAARGKYVAVTPLGAAPEFFDPREVTVKGLPSRYLLHVGNRHDHKNADLLFRAFAELSRTDPDLHLVLSGASLPVEDARLAELGIAGRTVRLRATDDQLPWLYHRAQAFVFPSRYEGFGLPVVEAMAAGAPTVASDIAVLREVGADAIDYVDPDDVDGLVGTLQDLLADEPARRRRIAAGRLRAGEFTWRRTAQSTAAAYRELLGGRR